MPTRVLWTGAKIKYLQELDQERKTLKEIAYAIEKKFGVVYTTKQISNAIRNYGVGERIDRLGRLKEEHYDFLKEKYNKGLSPKVIVAAFNIRFPDRIKKMTRMSFAVMCSNNRDLFPRRNKIRRTLHAETELRDDAK